MKQFKKFFTLIVAFVMSLTIALFAACGNKTDTSEEEPKTEEPSTETPKTEDKKEEEKKDESKDENEDESAADIKSVWSKYDSQVISSVVVSGTTDRVYNYKNYKSDASGNVASGSTVNSNVRNYTTDVSIKVNLDTLDLDYYTKQVQTDDKGTSSEKSYEDVDYMFVRDLESFSYSYSTRYDKDPEKDISKAQLQYQSNIAESTSEELLYILEHYGIGGGSTSQDTGKTETITGDSTTSETPVASTYAVALDETATETTESSVSSLSTILSPEGLTNLIKMAGSYHVGSIAVKEYINIIYTIANAYGGVSVDGNTITIDLNLAMYNMYNDILSVIDSINGDTKIIDIYESKPIKTYITAVTQDIPVSTIYQAVVSSISSTDESVTSIVNALPVPTATDTVYTYLESVLKSTATTKLIGSITGIDALKSGVVAISDLKVSGVISMVGEAMNVTIPGIDELKTSVKTYLTSVMEVSKTTFKTNTLSNNTHYVKYENYMSLSNYKLVGTLNDGKLEKVTLSMDQIQGYYEIEKDSDTSYYTYDGKDTISISMTLALGDSAPTLTDISKNEIEPSYTTTYENAIGVTMIGYAIPGGYASMESGASPSMSYYFLEAKLDKNQTPAYTVYSATEAQLEKLQSSTVTDESIFDGLTKLTSKYDDSSRTLVFAVGDVTVTYNMDIPVNNYSGGYLSIAFYVEPSNGYNQDTDTNELFFMSSTKYATDDIDASSGSTSPIVIKPIVTLGETQTVAEFLAAKATPAE